MRVLQIIDGEIFGGIAKIMSDIDNNIENIKFDYLTSVNVCDDWINLGISRKTLKGKIIYNHRLRKFLKNNKYDIVHINSGVFLFSFQIAVICKLSKIKKVIAHSHNTPPMSLIKKSLKKILNPLYRKITNIHIACSEEAAKSLFTKTDDVIILKNGIDTDKFRYNDKIRNQYRKKLNIENKIVYSHIGNFIKQKNHNFLIDLFYEIQKKENNSILILVGDGPLKNQIEDKVKKLKIEDKVLFLGFREDIPNLLCMSDIFLFPSLYEGFGIVLVEAQVNGLTIVTTNNIPNEVKISNNYYVIDNYDINSWVNTILNIKLNNREDSNKNIIENGYDIKEVSNQLEKIYHNLEV